VNQDHLKTGTSLYANLISPDCKSLYRTTTT